MGINLSKLQNVTQFSPDLGVLEGDIMQNIKLNAITTANGWLGFGIMTALFLFFLWHLHRKDGRLLYDITRSLVISSGFTTIYGLVLAMLGFIGDFKFVVWYGLIFVFALMAMVKIKQKGL